MIAKPRRRWFSYSLRTLLVVMTICCLLLGWQMKIVRERRHFLENLIHSGAQVLPLSVFTTEPAASNDSVAQRIRERPGLFRRLLGDEAYFIIYLPSLAYYRDESEDEEMARVRQLFPEADVQRHKSRLNFKQAAEQLYEKLKKLD